MSRTLLITSSPRGADSLSTRFAAQIAEAVRSQTDGRLTVRDLATDPLRHISEAYIHGRSAAPEERSPPQIEAVEIAQQLVDELKAADVIVMGSAMINFGLPSQLKAWFDHVIWPGVTFTYGDTGPQGLLTGKKVYLISAAGAVYSEGACAPLDFQTNYVRHLLGFIGLTDVELVRVEGTAFSTEAAQAVIAKTEAAVQSLFKKAA